MANDLPSSTPGERTLAEVLARTGPLRPEVAARIVVHACRALTAAPFAPGSRRDLDPAAIALCDADPTGRLAVAIRRAGEGGRAPGSPMYLSPEQITNASQPDARSDVYGLSVVAYEALAAALPLPRCATSSELVAVLCTEDAIPLESVATWIDPALVAVIARGLARDPAKRWASPRALGEALSPFTGGSDRLTADMLAGITAAERLRAIPMLKASRRRARPRVVLALASLLALALAGGWLAVRLKPPVPAQANVEPAREGLPRDRDPIAPPASKPAALPNKKDVALSLLEGKSLFLHLDPRRPGVVVPLQFRGQAQLVLQLGKEMAIPIPDLVVDDAGIRATLSFSHKPSLCKVPWAAIYALVGEDGKGVVWPDDVPPEVAAQMAKDKASESAVPR